MSNKMTDKKSSTTSDYDVDFENDEFDEIYNSLSKNDRKGLFEYKSDGTFQAKYSKDRMKEILRDLNSQEIKDFYNNYLTSKEREFVDSVRLPDRLDKIRGLGGQNKWKADHGIVKVGDSGIILKPKEPNTVSPLIEKKIEKIEKIEKKEGKYELEDEVEVYNPDERTRLHAIIIGVNTDNTYDVMYDDDSEETDVLAKYISSSEKFMKKEDVINAKYLEGRVHTPEDFEPNSPEFEPHSPEFSPHTPDMPPPPELLEKDIELEEVEETTKTSSQVLFSNLVESYYQSRPYGYEAGKMTELEVRFGTRGIRRLTKNDYDNVIKTLKSFGFKTINSSGDYSLRIQNEFMNNLSGKFELSNIRTEINGIEQIKMFCNSNNIKELIKSHGNSVKFTKKTAFANDKKERARPVNFDDFNFRVSLQSEESMSSNKGVAAYIVNTWRNNKKTFRFMNRVTFTHDSYPINVDISIVKSSDFRGNKHYTTDDADIFNRPESYEIELEVNNKMVGPGTEFKNYNIILESLRKVIKYVLSGLQHTNFPIAYSEQKDVIGDYMKLLFKDAYEPGKNVYSKHFIGPSSYTLQRINVVPVNENSNAPNIRNNYTVTDKADGDRHLMYISGNGKIYLINTSMNVIFTGAKTEQKELFDSLLDGELILHDKKGKFINLYAAFDIYYLNKVDVRSYTFMVSNVEPEMDKSRYALLNKLIQNLNVMSILEKGPTNKEREKEEKKSSFKSLSQKIQQSFVSSPIRITCKRFYPENPESGDIFNACNQIITKQKNGLFEYETDGLIFTPAFMGVGSDKVGSAGPLSKITWDYSFKWKPPQFNTIDFLVTTQKTTSGGDIIKNIFEEGTISNSAVQISQFKPIELRCTFIEKMHGFINPCQDIIDDKLPEYSNNMQEEKLTNEAKPMIFYPTNPYDSDTGLCNIMLRKDNNNSLQMFTEENEVFGDNTIVEFSYDFDRKKGWRWVPLRVRYDKTGEMLQGAKNFGNAYHVANSNWQSIHYPITEDMICTGLNIPEIGIDDDVYYNKPSGEMKTEALKNFHNLYVKKMLIKSVSKKDDTLIDYACGKAGDLSKWIAAKLSFVFGIDISKDNLENRLDGACARYLKAKKQNKHVPYALFVNGNSALNIKNGSAMRDDKAVQITKAIFGHGTDKSEQLGKGVARHYGAGSDGFNISSCQFAIHYFFKDPEILQGFLKNLAECTKLNGYFIGTAYDGKLIYKLLANKEKGESVQIYENDKKIWEIVKEYSFDKFEDNASSIGYRIDVFQESINQIISEYLINFDYFNRVMENYGFKIIEREEAQSLGLPEGSGLFSELFMNMMEEIKGNKFKANDYGNASNMSLNEKKISFLNRYFVYKKVRTVNPDKVEIDLDDYQEEKEGNEEKEIESFTSINKKEKEKEEEAKPKIKKLNKKLMLVPATEAIEEKPEFKLVEKVKKAKTEKPKKKLLIVEENE